MNQLNTMIKIEEVLKQFSSLQDPEGDGHEDEWVAAPTMDLKLEIFKCFIESDQ